MSSKGKGLIAYLLGWIGALIVLTAFKDNTKKDVMYAAQGIVISIGNILLSVIGIFVSQYIPFYSLIVWVLYLTIIIIAIVSVVNDKDPKLPLVGDIAESMFAKQLAAAPEVVATAPQANFDPNTGQPINPQPQANFDPNTGQPINPQPQANFDPNTGQPINPQPQANFDPNTGQPINQQPQANFDPNTGQPINNGQNNNN